MEPYSFTSSFSLFPWTLVDFTKQDQEGSAETLIVFPSQQTAIE